MIRVTCPACGRALELADYLAGLTVVCKGCTHPIPVPATRPNAPPPADAIQAAPPLPLGDAIRATPPPPAGPPLRHAPPADAIQSAADVRPPPPPAAPPPLPAAEPTGETPPDPGAVPDWAVEHARLALRIDMAGRDIQQRLVQRGLTPAAASAAVECVLAERFRQQSEALWRADRLLQFQRAVSGVIACVCLVLL